MNNSFEYMNLAGEGHVPTWREEAVEVTDNCTERGPECRLVVHAAGDQIRQFGPLGRRKVVMILVKQDFLGYINDDECRCGGLTKKTNNKLLPKQHPKPFSGMLGIRSNKLSL